MSDVTTRQVGVLFIDFENQKRMRLNGEAALHRDAHKMKLVQRSRFVPKSECAMPVPGWKKGDWVADTLPENDSARDDTREVI